MENNVRPIRSARYPVDQLGRPLRDLRISVMDRCNFRCTYCMPKDAYRGYRFLESQKRLSFQEIVRVSRLFAGIGVRKLRLTGGEPLLRSDLGELIGDLSAIDGIEDIALTTNGVLLGQHAADLYANGLRRVTVSLDSIDPATFASMSGGFAALDEVIAGIEAAIAAGLAPVKVNSVVIRGMNDATVLDLVEQFRGRPVILRFVEFMDVGNRNTWQPERV
ncbi:MAG: radical SAM protein, partial [Proteobacteria bacterium]|nr:radical SAM protein [Pseudomonadota bacterium]